MFIYNIQYIYIFGFGAFNDRDPSLLIAESTIFPDGEIRFALKLPSKETSILLPLVIIFKPSSNNLIPVSTGIVISEVKIRLGAALLVNLILYLFTDLSKLKTLLSKILYPSFLSNSILVTPFCSKLYVSFDKSFYINMLY